MGVLEASGGRTSVYLDHVISVIWKISFDPKGESFVFSDKKQSLLISIANGGKGKEKSGLS